MIRLVFSFGFLYICFLINPTLLSDYVKHRHLKAHLSPGCIREEEEEEEEGREHYLATENWSHFSPSFSLTLCLPAELEVCINIYINFQLVG